MLAEDSMSFSIKGASLEHFQEVYTFGKAGVSDRHDHVDGVEVFFTRKTSCEVGSGVDRSVKFPAQGTAKAQDAASDFARDLQAFFHYFSDGNVVADGAQVLSRKARFHVPFLSSLCLAEFWP